MMSLTVLLSVGFLTFLMVFLTIGSYRAYVKKVEEKDRPKLIIAKGYRTRERRGSIRNTP